MSIERLFLDDSGDLIYHDSGDLIYYEDIEPYLIIVKALTEHPNHKRMKGLIKKANRLMKRAENV